MKKFIVLVLCSMFFLTVKAEDKAGKEHDVYCEVVYYINALSKKTVNVIIDGEKYIIIKNGEEQKLSSATQAMRLLSEKGWSLRTSFGVTGANGLLPAEYHYIMAKTVISDDEMTDGLKEK